MLGAITILLLLAAAYAVTKAGGLIALVAVAAVLYLAYRRLSLAAYTVTFTVLLAAYVVLGAPAPLWKGVLVIPLLVLWALNVRPLRTVTGYE